MGNEGGNTGVLLQMTEPQITYRGMPHSPAMDARIVEYARKLEALHPRVTMCHVIVDEVDRRKQQGNLFEVHVDVHVPGHEIVASRKEHEDPYVAVHDAFTVIYRQLEEDVSRRRGQVKRHGDTRGPEAESGDTATP
jgi:ribosome-associated translation inhibitor RaiA